MNPTGDPRSNHDSVWRVSSSGGVPEMINDYGGAFALSRDGRYISVAHGWIYGDHELNFISARTGDVLSVAPGNRRISGSRR